MFLLVLRSFLAQVRRVPGLASVAVVGFFGLSLGGSLALYFGTDAGSLSFNFSSFTNIPGPDGMSASWLPRRLAHTLCWRPQGQTLRPDGWGQKPGPKSWVIPVSHPQFAQVVSMKSIAFAKPPQLASHPRSQGWEGVDLIVRSLLKRGLGMRLAVLLTLGGGLSEWLAYQ